METYRFTRGTTPLLVSIPHVRSTSALIAKFTFCGMSPVLQIETRAAVDGTEKDGRHRRRSGKPGEQARAQGYTCGSGLTTSATRWDI